MLTFGWRRTVVAGIARRSASVCVEEWKERAEVPKVGRFPHRGAVLTNEWLIGPPVERIWKFSVLRALDRVIAVASVNSVVER
jgi:hypothetical protein